MTSTQQHQFSSSSSSSSTIQHQNTMIQQNTTAVSNNTAAYSSNTLQTTSNETHVQGQKFNITNSLKKTSHHNSQEDIRSRSRHMSGQQQIVTNGINHVTTTSNAVSTTTKRSRQASGTNGSVVGCALKGLDAALDALAREQKAQEAVANKYQSKRAQNNNVQVTEISDGVTSVTVSLPSSRRTSA